MTPSRRHYDAAFARKLLVGLMALGGGLLALKLGLGTERERIVLYVLGGVLINEERITDALRARFGGARRASDDGTAADDLES